MKGKAYFAMACITMLEVYALYKGVDGALLSAVVALLAGLGGYEIAKRKTAKNQN